MKTITASELKKRLDKGEVLLVDVREPAEHRSECIDGACLIPLGEISIEKLPSTQRPIIIHCRSGKRSADACAKILKDDASLDVASLEGGIIAWIQTGFNVKRSGSTILPLDRQTQIAVGFIAFSGTILGTLINPTFYILPGFVEKSKMSLHYGFPFLIQAKIQILMLLNLIISLKMVTFLNLGNSM